ncbi:MAG: NADH-quinone oxidoreductase subunit NuoG [Gammaproteobacteria bacterium]
MTTFEIEIDGKKCQAKQGQMVIQVADEAGIPIPRFCYHKKLSVAANCRMCLVEIEKAPKTLPACATPVADGMKVFTQSKKTLESQRAVMEFLLINHPLDCPICDQGGQCELQDLSQGFGVSHSAFEEGKRSVKDDDLGPLVATEMTRCIQCTRCVRFGEEIAGVRELGATGRGEHMQIGTYIKHAVSHEMSGNIIDLCPVGALTSKPFRFRGRAWEMTQHVSVAPHDCIGSNTYIHTHYHRVKRVVPRENESINEVWISDRDRFGYLGVQHSDRLAKPLVKKNNQWYEVDWQEALNVVVDAFSKIKAAHGAQQIGALVSPSATTEEMFLVQRLMRAIGSNNIDHRLRQTDFADQMADDLFPNLGGAIANIDDVDAVLLLGSNTCREQPIAAHRLRKAALNGAKIMSASMLDHEFHFELSHKLISLPSQYVRLLLKLLKACAPDEGTLPAAVKNVMSGVESDEIAQAMIDALRQSENSVVYLGALAVQHPQASLVRYLAKTIARLTESRFGVLSEGANSAGAYLSGAIPHRDATSKTLDNAGLDVQAMLSQGLRAYLLHGVDPDFDFANPVLTRQALKQADAVVAVSTYDSSVLREVADVILPMATFGETPGTFVNVEGEWQSFQPCAKVFEESKPAWKIYRVLGNLFEIDGFDYEDCGDVLQELKELRAEDAIEVAQDYAPGDIVLAPQEGLERISQVPLYRADALVRHSDALQAMCEHEKTDALRVNAVTAKKLNITNNDRVSLKQGDATQSFVVVIDECVPDQGVLIPAAMESTANLGNMFGTVEVK